MPDRLLRDGRVLRYEVPVDDQTHAHTSGEPLHVDCRRPDVVEFWAIDDGHVRRRRYRVYGTGHPIPAGAIYHGTALAGPLVWHLMEVPDA
jgi:hypothetical protein